MAEHLTHFTWKKWVNYWLKTQEKQQEYNSMNSIRYEFWRTFAELNNPSSPKLAYKQAVEDELNINGGKHDFQLVFKLGIILNE